MTLLNAQTKERRIVIHAHKIIINVLTSMSNGLNIKAISIPRNTSKGYS